MHSEEFISYEWRVAFFFGAILAVLVFLIRLYMPESRVWGKIRLRHGMIRDGMPLTKDSPWIFIATSLLMTGYFYMYRSTAILYPLLMQSLGYPLTFIYTVYYIEAAGLMLLSHICVGGVSELVGRKRALILLGTFSTIFATAILMDLPSIAPDINTQPTFLGW